MNANVTKSDKSPIPAGIFGEGIEAFWYQGEKWVIASGVVQRFDESSSAIQQPIWRAFINDKQSLSYMATRMGLKKASETFDRWYRCVVGGLDNVPDVTDELFTPDAYNNMCSDKQCPHRGKLCSCGVGLLKHEVETIQSLAKGHSMDKVAESLFVSLPAIKSRVSKLHEKLNVTNTVALIARATQLGI